MQSLPVPAEPFCGPLDSVIERKQPGVQRIHLRQVPSTRRGYLTFAPGHLPPSRKKTTIAGICPLPSSGLLLGPRVKLLRSELPLEVRSSGLGLWSGFRVKVTVTG